MQPTYLPEAGRTKTKEAILGPPFEQLRAKTKGATLGPPFEQLRAKTKGATLGPPPSTALKPPMVPCNVLASSLRTAGQPHITTIEDFGEEPE